MPSVLVSAVKLLVGLMIFVGLPLLAWGPGETRIFIGHPARLGYIILTVLLQSFIVIRMPRAGSNRGAKPKTITGQRRGLIAIQVLSLAVVVVAPYCDRREVAVIGNFESVRYLGLVLFTLGFMAMHWAEASLDKQFSVNVEIQEGHNLITGGPYRHLRHPRYLGIIMFTMGLALVFRSWLTLVLVGALILVLNRRMHDEEKLLRLEFGSDWEAYARKTRRLIPYIY